MGYYQFNLDKNRVNVMLDRAVTNDWVFWSPRHNSYVCVEHDIGDYVTPEGVRVDLASVNGIGEIRWWVQRWQIENALRTEKEMPLDPTWDITEYLEAFKHFKLQLFVKKSA